MYQGEMSKSVLVDDQKLYLGTLPWYQSHTVDKTNILFGQSKLKGTYVKSEALCIFVNLT